MANGIIDNLTEAGKSALNGLSAGGKGIVERFSQEQKAGKVNNFAEFKANMQKAGDSIMRAGEQGWGEAEKFVEENTQEGVGKAVKDNGFSLGGLLGALAIGALLEMGPMGMIMLLIGGLLLGGLMDGKNSIIGGLLHGLGIGGEEKKPGGESPGKAHEQGVSNTPTHEIMLDKDGKVTTDKNAATVAMQGHFEGEGKDRKFHSDKAAVMQSVDGAAPSIPKDKDGNFIFSDVARDKGWLPAEATGDALKDSPELKALAATVAKVTGTAPGKDPVKPEVKKADDKQPAEKKPEEKKADDKQPENQKPEEKKADDKQPGDKKAEEKKAEEIKPEEPKKAEQAKPADALIPTASKISLVDDKGAPATFKTFYVTKDGLMTDKEHGDAAMHGVQDFSNNTFTITHTAGRNLKTGEFDMMEGTSLPKLEALPETQRKSATMPVRDGAIDLTDETTHKAVAKFTNAAVGKQEAVIKTEVMIEERNQLESEQKRDAARLAAIENNTKLRVLSTETDPYNGTTTYTFMQKGFVNGEVQNTKFEGYFENSRIGSYGAPSTNLIITRGAIVKDKSEPITDANNIVSAPIVYKDHKLQPNGEVKEISFVPEGQGLPVYPARVNVDTLIAAKKGMGETVTMKDVNAQPIGTGQSSGPLARQ